MCFACQDLASRIKISQITYFSCVFLGKKTLAHGEPKTQIWQIDFFKSRVDFHQVVWQYHAFCLSQFGFTHQTFTNYQFFLSFLMKKDPCTW
jgi:hypothetical protein